MCVLAIAYGMAHLVNPYYSLSAIGILSNDKLFFAAFILTLSILLTGTTFAATQADARPLFPIRFGLRRMFGAMTVVACLLALGPVGYFMMLAAVVGTVSFAIAYEYTRVRSGATW